MNKKILLILMMMLLLVGTVSAVGIDYSNEDMTAHIKDTILFGLINIGEQGTMELKSHKTVDEVLSVGIGWQVTMYYDTNFGKLQQGALGEVTFIDQKTGEEVLREWKYVYLAEEEYENPVMENFIVTRYETLTRSLWKDYNSKDIPQGQIRIGIMVNNLEGDYIDGIWEVQGKKIKKHAEWTASLNVGLQNYYTLDDNLATTVVIDGIGNNNGVLTNAGNTEDISSTGKVGTAFDFDGDDDYVNISGSYSHTSNQSYSVNAWAYFGTSSQVIYSAVGSSAVGSIHSLWWRDSDDQLIFGVGKTDGTIANVNSNTGGSLTGGWHMITSTAEQSGADILQKIYINASNIFNTTVSDKTIDDFDGKDILLGSYQQTDGGLINKMNGTIDEFGLWHRVLTPAEIVQIYNGGNGITYIIPNPAPTSTLNAPADAAIVSNPGVAFNATGTDNLNLDNMSLIVNGTYISTNGSVINNTLTTFLYTLPSAEFYNWTVEACDNASSCTNATFREITYANALAITLGNPIDYYNSSSSLMSLNGTPTDDTSIVNVILFLNGSVNGTDTSITNNTLVDFDRTLSDGYWNWTLQVHDAYAYVNATFRVFTIDTTDPVMSISAPVDPIAFHEINTNIFLNWTINDSNLDACWYDYLDVNTTVTCGDNTTTINITDAENRTIIIFANDTLGNINSESITWEYTFFQSGKSFSSTAYETDDEKYSINLSIPAAVTDISSFLSYNGTTHAATSTCTGTACYITSSLDIPLMDTTADFELNPFNWVITTLTGGTTATLTTDSENQNVSAINFTACGAGHSAVLFNISKEHDATPLVASFDATFKYYIGDGTVIKTEKSAQSAAASYEYCISPNETYIVSSTLFVDATGFESRNFDFNKETYDNLSQIVQPLRLANSTYQTVSNIIIEVSDSGLAPLENILVNISRYFPATDSYLLVESQITDEFGEIVAKLIETDVKYKFQFYNSAGTLLKTSDKTTIACRATICILPFVIESTLDDLGRFDTPDLYSSTLSFDNATNKVTFFWDDQTGSSTTTTLEVVRYNFNESTTVCSNTSTSALSTMVCGVGDSTATYKVQVTRDDGSDSFRIAVLDFKVGENFTIYGMEGLLWVFILLFTCIGIGAFNPSVGIGLYGVAFMMMGIIGIISMPLSVFFANTVLCILFIWGVNK